MPHSFFGCRNTPCRDTIDNTSLLPAHSLVQPYFISANTHRTTPWQSKDQLIRAHCVTRKWLQYPSKTGGCQETVLCALQKNGSTEQKNLFSACVASTSQEISCCGAARTKHMVGSTSTVLLMFSATGLSQWTMSRPHLHPNARKKTVQ